MALTRRSDPPPRRDSMTGADPLEGRDPRSGHSSSRSGARALVQLPRANAQPGERLAQSPPPPEKRGSQSPWRPRVGQLRGEGWILQVTPAISAMARRLTAPRTRFGSRSNGCRSLRELRSGSFRFYRPEPHEPAQPPTPRGRRRAPQETHLRVLDRDALSARDRALLGRAQTQPLHGGQAVARWASGRMRWASGRMRWASGRAAGERSQVGCPQAFSRQLSSRLSAPR
jgi:hypothetical protein